MIKEIKYQSLEGATRQVIILVDQDQNLLAVRNHQLVRTKAKPKLFFNLYLTHISVAVPESDYTQDYPGRTHAFRLEEQAREKRAKARDHIRANDGLTAQYYSQEAAQLSERAAQAHKKAADEIFHRNNQKHRGNSVIDLHGLHVNEGLQKLRQELKKHTTGELQVITGRGRNSHHNYGKIKLYPSSWCPDGRNKYICSVITFYSKYDIYKFRLAVYCQCI